MNQAGINPDLKLSNLKKIFSDPLTKEAFLLTTIPDTEKFDVIENLF
jgi:hypothetical protein